MLTLAICDDEREHIQILRLYLEEYFHKQNRKLQLDFYQDGRDLVQAVTGKKCYDAIFLDVEMGDQNGVDVAASIRENNSEVPVLFVTSHSEFALKSYDVRAFDYIVKPIQVIKLHRSLDFLCKALKENEEKGKSRKLVITKNKIVQEIHHKDIMYCVKSGNKVVIYCKEEKVNYYTSLSELKEELDNDCFVQCHQGYIVNKAWVASNINYRIHLKTGIEIPVSRKFAKEIRTLL